MHKAWSVIEEEPYFFLKSSVKILGYMGRKMDDFDLNWAFPDCKSSSNPQMAIKSLRFALLCLLFYSWKYWCICGTNHFTLVVLFIHFFSMKNKHIFVFSVISDHLCCGNIVAKDGQIFMEQTSEASTSWKPLCKYSSLDLSLTLNTR